MEHCKISKLLNELTESKFVTRKWIQVNYLTGGQYFVNKNIRFKTSIPYILAKPKRGSSLEPLNINKTVSTESGKAQAQLSIS